MPPGPQCWPASLTCQPSRRPSAADALWMAAFAALPMRHSLQGSSSSAQEGAVCHPVLPSALSAASSAKSCHGTHVHDINSTCSCRSHLARAPQCACLRIRRATDSLRAADARARRRRSKRGLERRLLLSRSCPRSTGVLPTVAPLTFASSAILVQTPGHIYNDSNTHVFAYGHKWLSDALALTCIAA